MYCSKCGIKLQEDSKFCPHCGNQVMQKELLKNHVSEKNEIAKNKLQGKTLLIGIAVIIVIIILICAGTGSLEEKLVGKTWYEDPDFTDYYQGYGTEADVIKFYSNNRAEIVEYYYSPSDDGDDWDTSDYRETDWEILDDKTLHYRGDYYKWKEDWNLSGNKLIIGETTYYSKDKWNYDVD